MAWARFDLLLGTGIPIAWNERVGGGEPYFRQLEPHRRMAQTDWGISRGVLNDSSLLAQVLYGPCDFRAQKLRSSRTLSSRVGVGLLKIFRRCGLVDMPITKLRNASSFATRRCRSVVRFHRVANVRATKSDQPSAIAPSSHAANRAKARCRSAQVLRRSTPSSAARASAEEQLATCVVLPFESVSTIVVAISKVVMMPKSTAPVQKAGLDSWLFLSRSGAGSSSTRQVFAMTQPSMPHAD